MDHVRHSMRPAAVMPNRELAAEIEAAMEPKDKPCSWCEGRGIVGKFTHVAGKGGLWDAPCGTCRGTGRLPLTEGGEVYGLPEASEGLDLDAEREAMQRDNDGVSLEAEYDIGGQG